VAILKDLDQKPLYDDTFEKGHVIVDLPLDTSLVY